MMEPWLFAVLFVITAVFGLRGSIRLTWRYLDVVEQLDERERWVLLAFVLTAWVITAAALWYGFLSVRTVLGFQRIEGIATVSALIATGVLLIPTFLDAVVSRVARVDWPVDR